MDSSPLNYQGSPKIMFFTYIYIYKYIFILYIVEYSYAQLQERMKFCNNMDGLGGYHAYWNKRKTNTTYIWNLEIQETNEYNRKGADSQI